MSLPGSTETLNEVNGDLDRLLETLRDRAPRELPGVPLGPAGWSVDGGPARPPPGVPDGDLHNFLLSPDLGMDASAATIIAQANARASLMCSVSAATDGRKKAIKKALDKENDEWREKYVERPAEHFRLNLIGHGFGIDEDHSCYADVDRENLQLAREYYAQNDRQIGRHGQSACQCHPAHAHCDVTQAHLGCHCQHPGSAPCSSSCRWIFSCGTAQTPANMNVPRGVHCGAAARFGRSYVVCPERATCCPERDWRTPYLLELEQRERCHRPPAFRRCSYGTALPRRTDCYWNYPGGGGYSRIDSTAESFTPSWGSRYVYKKPVVPPYEVTQGMYYTTSN